jgi:hypothetical protein
MPNGAQLHSRRFGGGSDLRTKIVVVIGGGKADLPSDRLACGFPTAFLIETLFRVPDAWQKGSGGRLTRRAVTRDD